MKDDKLYLIHIAECIGRIESYVSGIDAEAFMSSSLVQDAVIRNLQIMAESTQCLSDRLKETQPTIDWYRISGFRNILVHDYLGVDVERVWNIIKRNPHFEESHKFDVGLKKKDYIARNYKGRV